MMKQKLLPKNYFSADFACFIIRWHARSALIIAIGSPGSGARWMHLREHIFELFVEVGRTQTAYLFILCDNPSPLP